MESISLLTKEKSNKISTNRKNRKLKVNNISCNEDKFYHDTNLGLNVIIMQNLLDRDMANNLFNALLKIEYNSEENSSVMLYGTKYKNPRRHTAFGIANTTYIFSGNKVGVHDWDDKYESDDMQFVAGMTRFIKNMLSRYSKKEFNYALINMCPDGKSKIGYHSDEDKKLGDKPCIMDFSLGQGRYMNFKHKKTGKVVKVYLPHNSLISINYPTNNNWEHSIPSISKKIGPRVSITYRSIDK